MKNIYHSDIYKFEKPVNSYWEDTTSENFNLKKENEILLNENSRLKTLVFSRENLTPVDTLLEQKYDLFPSLIYKNSFENAQSHQLFHLFLFLHQENPSQNDGCWHVMRS